MQTFQSHGLLVQIYNYFGSLSGTFLWSLTHLSLPPNSFTPKYILKWTEYVMNTYTHALCVQKMLIEVLLIIATNKKQLECPSTREWIYKFWHIHRMEYYTPIKNTLLIHTMTHVKMKNTMLRVWNKSLKTNTHYMLWDFIHAKFRIRQN